MPRTAIKPKKPTLNRAESPLSWLFARKHITHRQLAAGEALRRDWERASLPAIATMRWDGSVPSSGRRSAVEHGHMGEGQLAAKQRFEEAVAMAGRDLADICWRVICAGEAVPMVEKDMGWPVRSGKVVLRIALDRIADYYRIPGAETAKDQL